MIFDWFPVALEQVRGTFESQGLRLLIKRRGTATLHEIEFAEARLGTSLPGPYRAFLVEWGGVDFEARIVGSSGQSTIWSLEEALRVRFESGLPIDDVGALQISDELALRLDTGVVVNTFECSNVVISNDFAAWLRAGVDDALAFRTCFEYWLAPSWKMEGLLAIGDPSIVKSRVVTVESSLKSLGTLPEALTYVAGLACDRFVLGEFPIEELMEELTRLRNRYELTVPDT